MSRTLYDYDAIKREYITSAEAPSIRDLAKRHGVKSFSTVAEKARREGWAERRDQFHALKQTKVMERVADQQADKVAEIRKDALEVVHAAILKMGADLEDRFVTDPESGNVAFVPAMKVTPSDLAKLITQLQLLTGGATSRTENLDLGLTGNVADLPPELLRGLLAVARSKGAGGEPVGQSPLPRIAGAKSVN